MMRIQKKKSHFIEEEKDKMRPHTLLFHYQLVGFVLVQFIIIEFKWFIWSQIHKIPKTCMPYLSPLLVCIKEHMHATWRFKFVESNYFADFQTSENGLSLSTYMYVIFLLD